MNRRLREDFIDINWIIVIKVWNSIDRTIKQGEITFEIDRLELGDNFATIYHEMSPFTAGEMLKRVQLYQGDEPLELIKYPYSQTRGGAICFEAASNTENLVLYIAQINSTKLVNMILSWILQIILHPSLRKLTGKNAILQLMQQKREWR